MDQETRNSLISVYLPLISAFAALFFGLSAFLFNALSRAPALNRRRQYADKIQGSKYWIVNNGTGPAIVTRLIVRYDDWENEISCDVAVDGNADWFYVLWEKIIETRKLKRLNKDKKYYSKRPDCRFYIYNMNQAIIAASDTLMVIETYPDASKENLDRFNEMLKKLDLVVSYKSMSGIRYKTGTNYHPAGTFFGRPILFSVYLLIARILGIYKG